MRKIVVLIGCIAALVAAVAASAHPLGNFTINRYSRIEVSGNRAYVLYVLDMAEIPTFQARQAGGIDGSAYATRIARNAHLSIDGAPAALTVLSHRLAFPRGQGGLDTTRLEVVLQGPVVGRGARLAYRDSNYAGRLGWKEIVVQGAGGASVTSSTVPQKSVSEELHAYPKDLLTSPLDVTSASALVEPGDGVAVPPSLTTGADLQAPDRVADSGFSRLIAQRHLSVLVILGALAAAMFWGMAHALSPGHGKTIVTAYLVGQRGTPRHAALLGLITTVTHTIGVFTLGGITLALSQFIVPDTLFPWLNLVSGLLVVGVGTTVLVNRYRGRGYGTDHTHGEGHDHAGSHESAGGHDHSDDHVRAHAHDDTHEHDHGDAHDHGHAHGDVQRLRLRRPGAPGLARAADSHAHHTHHHHGEPKGPGMRGLLAVGISGGLLPCPSALVVLLAAISLHRVAFGLVLILAFSLGLALTITAVGLAAVLAKKAFSRISFEGRLVRLLPAASAAVIVVAGIVMTAHALPGLHG